MEILEWAWIIVRIVFYTAVIVYIVKHWNRGNEEVDEMTTAEFNQYLENIAKLIEANAKDAETAAQIVRDSKVKA
ncbi:MAG: hypothetical protein IJ955_02465 [Oscillospiraceae bacterium]|nr:hypothetical protein [Oscillospiraceae bacterium]